jgi:hypothetical protein
MNRNSNAQTADETASSGIIDWKLQGSAPEIPSYKTKTEKRKCLDFQP